MGWSERMSSYLAMCRLPITDAESCQKACATLTGTRATTQGDHGPPSLVTCIEPQQCGQALSATRAVRSDPLLNLRCAFVRTRRFRSHRTAPVRCWRSAAATRATASSPPPGALSACELTRTDRPRMRMTWPRASPPRSCGIAVTQNRHPRTIRMAPRSNAAVARATAGRLRW